MAERVFSHLARLPVMLNVIYTTLLGVHFALHAVLFA
jgi:hypothetical protein